jgi:hypothetical protein
VRAPSLALCPTRTLDADSGGDLRAPSDLRQRATSTVWPQKVRASTLAQRDLLRMGEPCEPILRVYVAVAEGMSDRESYGDDSELTS